MSDLAEIATICALESGVTIVAVVDSKTTLARFVGIPVVASLDALATGVDAVVVTDLQTAPATVAAAVDKLGAHRVLVPVLLGVEILANKDMVR